MLGGSFTVTTTSINRHQKYCKRDMTIKVFIRATIFAGINITIRSDYLSEQRESVKKTDSDITKMLNKLYAFFTDGIIESVITSYANWAAQIY